jgi:uncharacterized membrane protein YgdD (TMEM256/DUF423 family)
MIGSSPLGALGAINAAVAVAAGAFGAHALRERLAPRALEIFEVAVRYHMYHAIAMILAGLAVAAGARGAAAAGWMFQAGIAVFSGSLYALALSDLKWLGAVTPIGGLAFLAGWGMLAWAWWRGGA